MKGFMKMRLVPKLAPLVIIVVSIMVPLSGSIAYAHTDVPWVSGTLRHLHTVSAPPVTAKYIGEYSTGRLLSTTPPSLAKPISPAASALTIDKVYTTNNQGKEKTDFAPGEEIWFVEAVNNSSGKTIAITVTFQVLDPSGNKVGEITGRVNKLPEGPSSWYLRSKVPDKATPGKYTLKASVVDQGNPGNRAEGQGTFTVTGGKSIRVASSSR